MKLKTKKQKDGFTLMEMLVALAVFGVVVGIASGYFVSAISVQRDTLAIRPMVDEISFVAEYMSRALRPAQRSGDVACLSAAGIYYELISAETVRFIDRDERCREISYESIGRRVLERISTDNSEDFFGSFQPLTSPALDVQNLQFEVPVSGARHAQVTFSMEVRPLGDAPVQPLRVQTTISQREF